MHDAKSRSKAMKIAVGLPGRLNSYIAVLPNYDGVNKAFYAEFHLLLLVVVVNSTDILGRNRLH